jgi:hypothetical protein
MRSITRQALAIGCWGVAAMLFTIGFSADTTPDLSNADAAAAPGSEKSELTETEKVQREWENTLEGTWMGTNFLNQTFLSFTANRQYRYEYNILEMEPEVGEWRIEMGPDRSQMLVYESRKIGTHSVESLRWRILKISSNELKLRPLAPTGQDKIITFHRIQRV